MTKFVFEGWVKGIAFGIFTLLFSYIIAGFCFGFVRSYLDSIQIATATQEESFGVAAGLVLYMLVVAAFVVRVPSLAQSFAYGTLFHGISTAGGIGETLQTARNRGSRAANLATSVVPAGLTGGAIRGTMAMGGDVGRGTRAMGRMLASRMRGRPG
jgi:type IV secretion system protein VirB6